jgi:hypothetical protein
MSDEALIQAIEAMQREKASLLEQAAILERKIAEIAQLRALAAKHNLVVSAPAVDPTAPALGSAPLTIKALMDRYLSDPRSPYLKLRPASRKFYDRLMLRIIDDCGHERIADLTDKKIRGYYESWVEGGKISISHARISMLRGLATFGRNELEDADCKALSFILHDMKFEMPKSRKEQLTAKQAEAIRAEAHAQGKPSIALAQAFQFDCGLTQKDCIGEWVPLTDSPPSEIIGDNEKWVRGLRWNEIGDDLVLRHAPSWGGETIEHPLTECPMVRDELRRLGARPKSGPIIVNEQTKLPYSENTFRYVWRRIADAVGVPKAVRNADSRLKRKLERNLRSKVGLERSQPLQPDTKR